MTQDHESLFGVMYRINAERELGADDWIRELQQGSTTDPKLAAIDNFTPERIERLATVLLNMFTAQTKFNDADSMIRFIEAEYGKRGGDVIANEDDPDPVIQWIRLLRTPGDGLRSEGEEMRTGYRQELIILQHQLQRLLEPPE